MTLKFPLVLGFIVPLALLIFWFCIFVIGNSGVGTGLSLFSFLSLQMFISWIGGWNSRRDWEYEKKKEKERV